MHLWNWTEKMLLIGFILLARLIRFKRISNKKFLDK